MILAALLSLLGSTAFGTIFGGLMGLLNRRTDLAYKKLEYADKEKQREHEILLRQKDAEIMAQEWMGRGKVAEIEGEAVVGAEAFRTMSKSYEFAKPREGSWLEDFTSFVRPFVSLAYFVITAIGAYFILKFAFSLDYILWEEAAVLKLVMFVVEWLAFMASSTIGWWFAMRAGKEPPRLK